MMTTKIIRYLDVDEKLSLDQEIQSASTPLWTKHISDRYPADARAATALLDGDTIHLKWPVSRSSLEMPIQDDKFPTLMRFIDGILCGGTLGRAYIHRLGPGRHIRRHTDHLHILNGQQHIIKRYQIYFDIPDPVTLVLDGNAVSDSSIYRYSLVDFDLTRPHEYINLSDMDWFFVVFDLVR